MPKEYIARLVMDRRHRSCAIVKPATKGVLGGITYRPFHAQAGLVNPKPQNLFLSFPGSF